MRDPCKPRRCDPLKRVTVIDDAQRGLLDRTGPFPAPGRVPGGGTTDRPAGRPGHGERPKGDRDDDNFNPDGSRKDRDERKPRYDVKLICRTFVGDVGARPLGNMVFWESPDIWIEGSSGDPDVATPGAVNQVKVHVWNTGLADAWGAHVELYWCDPSVGIDAVVAQPIGSTVIPLFAGQHQVVSFDWVPVFVNNGHACLVAQVYDPVSDPIVAPFGPVHDRHVGQRNISVLNVPAGNRFTFDFFSQNVTLTPATTVLEIQKLELEALDVVAMALGTRAWRTAGGHAPRLLPPVSVREGDFESGSPFANGVFREALRQGPPGVSEMRRVSAALRSRVAPFGPRDRVRASAMAEQKRDRDGDGKGVGSARDDPGRLDKGAWDPGVWQTDCETEGQLALAPGRHFRLTFEGDVPGASRPGTADVYRIVERTAGRITGGITLVVRTT